MDMLDPLIERLKRADLNQVAEAADVSRKTLARIMARKNSPTVRTASKISTALDTLKVPKSAKRKPATAAA